MQGRKYMDNLIIIGGPTATGKTDLAISLAKNIGGEIINADSVQIYKRLNIGSNKGHLTKTNITLTYNNHKDARNFVLNAYKIEQSEVIGWLFDVVDLDESFSLADYQFLATNIIKDIWHRGKTPILVGGTGLYIDSVIKGYEITGQSNQELRQKLNSLKIIDLQKMVTQLGGTLEELNNSDRNNPRRLIRIIEKLNFQVDISLNQKIIKANVFFFYPQFEREKLEISIKNRVVQMIEHGFVREVEEILGSGFSHDLKALQSAGYKQIISYLDDEIQKSDLVDKISIAHRKYAKRQITWFEGKARGYSLIRVKSANEALKYLNENGFSFR